MTMTMRLLKITCFVLVLMTCAHAAKAQDILLIASTHNKGTGPFTSTIQTPLVLAGYTVQVWDQLTLGWPPIDTLWNYDAVFFHGSERRATGTIDSVLTSYVEQGGRLVIEGSNIASYGGAYPEFEKKTIHADWQRVKQTTFTHQVVNAAHPIATGLPATFTATGYSGGGSPDRVLPAHGGTLVIQFQNNPGTAAVVAAPRLAFVCGSLQRVTTGGGVRNTLITNLVNWVLQDPNDTGVIDMGYRLGTSVGQACPVWARVRNYSAADTGQVILQASTDSSTWSNIDTAFFDAAGYETDSLLFSWTPAVEGRYYLRAILTVTGSDAYAANNAAGMMVTTFDNAVHPKLFFTAAQIPTLQSQAMSTHLPIYQQLNTRVSQDYTFNPLPPAQWEDVNFSEMARMLSIASLKAVITPTSIYLNNAKNKAMALCRYPHWETGNVDMDIYSGRCCFALALAYDWLYPHFSKAQRDTIQLKLREQMQRLAAAEPKWIWWPDAYVHNHNVNSMSYLGSACYALYEEEPEALIWEELAIENLDSIMELYGPVTDGSWYEAMNYWGFISWTMLPHLWLLREQRGIDYFDTPWIQSMADYRIYGSHPIPTQMPMINEAQPDEWYGPDDQLALFAREYNNTHAQWMRQQVVSRLGYSLDGPLGFFFYDPSKSQTVPTDLSWIATDQDTYFGRSAWNDTTSTYVTLKCGLPCGRHAYERFWGVGSVGGWEPSHFLPEQNGFTLSYGRDYFVQPAGLQSPLHRTYNTTTMLVNGQGQIGDSTKGAWTLPADELSMDPHLADTFMLKTVDYVVGDATTSYPSGLGLTRFKRHMLYVRPDLLVVLDDMRASNPSTFTFIIRNPGEIFDNDSSKIYMDGSATDADMHMLAPANRSYQYSFDYYYKTDWGGWGQRISNAVPDTSVRFVNAFYPRSPNPANAELLFGDKNLTVVRVGTGNGYEATCAITHGHTNVIDVDSLWTDASLAVVVRNDTSDAFTFGAVRQGTIVDWGETPRRLFESPTPVDVEWTVHGDTLRVDGQIGDWARIYAPDMVFVWLNGEAEPYNQNGPLIEIGNLENVPNGRILDLVIQFDEELVKLDWSRPTFYINGVLSYPDMYDIYAADRSEGPFFLIDTIRGDDDRYIYLGTEDLKFFYVVARIEPAAARVGRGRAVNGKAAATDEHKATEERQK